MPSHSSPASITLLPHDGFGLHLLVSRKQFPPHVIVPDANPKSVQLFIAPKLLVSQCSPLFIELSPQNG